MAKRRLSVLIFGLLALAGGLLLSRETAKNPARVAAVPKPLVTAPAPLVPQPSKETVAQPVASSRSAASEIISSDWLKPAHPAFAAFREWTSRYLAADPAERSRLVAEGLNLARERRPVLAALIRSSPEAALAAAVPMVVRQQLPAEINSQLEQRVSGLSRLSLVAVTPVSGESVAEPVFRSTLIDGQEFRAYVYGRRADQSTVTSTSIVGVAIDGALAVSESPLRVLESGETAAGRPLDTVCAISGNVTPTAADTPLNVAVPNAVEFNGQVHVLCHQEHVALLAQRLIDSEQDNIQTAADGQPGSSGVSGRPTSAWTHGTKKVLIIRVDFSDVGLQGTPVNPANSAMITPDVAVSLITGANGVAAYYTECSYSASTLQIAATVSGTSTDVTGVLRMPQTAAYYAVGDTSGAFNETLHTDARTAAQNAGYNVSSYDRVGVVFSYLGNITNSQITYGGLGEIIGTNFWINGYYVFNIVAHEIGHNYGLNHANLWQVTDGNPVSPAGTSVEYGDVFDVMGGGTDYTDEFTHWNKSILQWIPDTAVTLANTAGTYRVYRFDAGAANLANPRALKIVRDGTTDYWIGYRRATTNAALNGGAYIIWGYNTNRQGNLLDMTTPGVNPGGVHDEALAVGATFNDTADGITIKTVDQGGSGSEQYLDVQVGFQPRIEWSQPTFVVDEQAGNVVLTLVRGQNSTGAVSVNWSTSPGTATSPADFTTQSGTVNWAAGDSSNKTIVIPIVASASSGGTQNFTVTLGTVTGGVAVGNLAATVTIADPGVRDPTFNANFVNNSVQKILPMPDGSMILGGWFSQIQDAGFNSYSRSGVTRLTSAGAVDPTFAAGGGTDTVPVYDLALQPDGKIIAVGNFASFNGTARNRVVRLNADGSVDTSFAPGTGANGTVYAVLVQPDGRIIIGGAFTSYNGTARQFLARLNTDGSLDSTFAGPAFVSAGGPWMVESLAMQSDGKILVGGQFYFSGSPFKSGLCRVLSTGAIDSTFSGVTNGAHVAGNTSSLRNVYSIVVQPDGKILIGGDFTGFNGTAEGGVARLTTTGALDGTFTTVTSDGACNTILLLPDGTILIGGTFGTIDGTASAHVARLSSTGAVNTSFASAGGFGSTVDDLELLPNGRVLLGGNYSSFQGSTNNGPIWQFLPGLSGTAGTLQFASATYSGNEGSTVNLSVTRTGGSLGAQTVGYTTVPGTATAADYTPTSGTLSWASGDASAKTIAVALTADALSESTETFSVNLGQPLVGGADLGAIPQATVSILNVTAVTPADFNADGKSDLLWQDTLTGDRLFWLMNGTSPITAVDLGTLPTDWSIAGIGDFNGDGDPDIVWQNTVTGERLIWLMNGTTAIDAVSLGTVSTDWLIVGTGDMNGDGKADLLWTNAVTGERTIWLMNGTTPGATISLGVVPFQWSLAGSGDFNADGQTDLLWQNTLNGTVNVWLMNGTTPASTVSLGTVSPQLQIAGTGDYNGDGKPDILWTNRVTGERTVWLMNGTVHSSTVSITTLPLNWVLVHPVARRTWADFNSDGKSDIIWENTATGQGLFYLMNGTTPFTAVAFGTSNPALQVAATGDFNADGKADLVWQNTSTGDRFIWLMNGTTMSSSVDLGVVSTDWSIIGTGDFNADGYSDLIWKNTVTGEYLIWLMNGTTPINSISLGVINPQLSFGGTGDFNADGNTDILWQNTSTGERLVWLMNGTTMSSSVTITTVATVWSITGTGDFNADGQTDLLWTNTSTGERLIWLMNGTVPFNSFSLGTFPVAWTIRN